MKTLGIFMELGGRSVVESLAAGGFDYLIIDTEHGPFSVESTAEYICAAENEGIIPYVRVGGISRSDILRMLDIGARALIIPNICSPEEVRTVIEYAKFPPIGKRGYCPTRFNRWGAADWSKDVLNYMEYTNQTVSIYPQCETLGALESIEEIVSTEGVDGIFVGPCDLSIAMGIPLQFKNHTLISAILRVLDACKSAGKKSIIFASNIDDAVYWLEQGFDSVTIGLDAVILQNACRSTVESMKGRI